MEELFKTMMETPDIEMVFDAVGNKALKDYYALFISAMAYYKFIQISPEFASKLYVTVVNSGMTDPNLLLENIYNFLINKSIDNIEKEINEEN